MEHEKFVRLFSRYEGNVRAFVASLLPNWQGVDEVMQEASIVMWRKFDQFDTNDPDSSFKAWAFMIARYEVLKYRRKWATDRLVFDEELLEVLSEEAAVMCENQDERIHALRTCIQKLQPNQQKMIKACYEDECSIKDVAKKIGKTQTALYQALSKIRRSLHQCILLSLKEAKS